MRKTAATAGHRPHNDMLHAALALAALNLAPFWFSQPDGKMASKEKEADGAMAKEDVPGIVYLSRVPPFMKPEKIRHLLSQFGEVGRVFLQAEGSFEAK